MPKASPARAAADRALLSLNRANKALRKELETARKATEAERQLRITAQEEVTRLRATLEGVQDTATARQLFMREEIQIVLDEISRSASAKT